MRRSLSSRADPSASSRRGHCGALIEQPLGQSGIGAVRPGSNERDASQQGLRLVGPQAEFRPAILELGKRNRYFGCRAIPVVPARARDDLDVVQVRLAGDGGAFGSDAQRQ